MQINDPEYRNISILFGELKPISPNVKVPANGPSSPAPCEKVATQLLQSEKATRLLKMRRN